MNVFISMI